VPLKVQVLPATQVTFTTATGAWLLGGGGGGGEIGAETVTDLEVAFVSDPPSVTVRVTVYVPPVAYEWDGVTPDPV
jgi:hypothetical protein